MQESTTDSPNVRIMPPAVFNACLFGCAVIEFFFPTTLSFVPQEAALVLGLLIAGSGFAFMMWGHGRFQDLNTAVKTILPASLLVTEGAYRYSRNPMYVGFLAILAGIGLAARSFWILAFVLPLALYLSFYVIPREEAYLARRFGQAFEAYCKKVRRWIWPLS